MLHSSPFFFFFFSFFFFFCSFFSYVAPSPNLFLPCIYIYPISPRTRRTRSFSLTFLRVFFSFFQQQKITPYTFPLPPLMIQITWVLYHIFICIHFIQKKTVTKSKTCMYQQNNVYTLISQLLFSTYIYIYMTKNLELLIHSFNKLRQKPFPQRYCTF